MFSSVSLEGFGFISTSPVCWFMSSPVPVLKSPVCVVMEPPGDSRWGKSQHAFPLLPPPSPPSSSALPDLRNGRLLSMFLPGLTIIVFVYGYNPKGQQVLGVKTLAWIGANMKRQENNMLEQRSESALWRKRLKGVQKRGKCVALLAPDKSSRKCTFVKAEALQQPREEASKKCSEMNWTHCFHLCMV